MVPVWRGVLNVVAVNYRFVAVNYRFVAGDLSPVSWMLFLVLVIYLVFLVCWNVVTFIRTTHVPSLIWCCLRSSVWMLLLTHLILQRHIIPTSHPTTSPHLQLRHIHKIYTNNKYTIIFKRNRQNRPGWLLFFILTSGSWKYPDPSLILFN